MIHGKIKNAVVIGAGISGLATAKNLTRKGISCRVYDRNSKLGGVWADGYHGFGVQIPKDLYEFPDFPLPDEVPHYTPGPEFQKYMEEYCDHFGIRDCLQLGTRVTALRRSGDGWTLEVEDESGSNIVQTDLVVIATGLYSETPQMPEIEGQDQFQGDILHNSQVKDIEMLRGRRVAVVGYGKSAGDIAGAAIGVADKVYLVFRSTHWPVPRKLLGLLPFKWGMLTRLVAAMIPPYVRSTPVTRALHTVGYPLPWLFWRVVEMLLRIQQKLGTRIANGDTLIPVHPIDYDAYSEVTMVPRPGFIESISAGEISAHRSGLRRFTENELILEDGDTLSVDCVVFGTGWKTGFGFLPKDLRIALGEEPDGIYLYRHILHPDAPNLAFVGRASSFMSVTTFSLQARWLSEVVARNVTLPSKGDMLAAIASLRHWKQSWMPDGAARSATLLLHMTHYHDELLLDMGADPLRKTGILAPLKELFVPYQASDFRDVI
ncbi:flavin-containing monooxygenase [Roseovarius aestuarii]|uniref:Trimethylamine monooxygenase n=1 Tax=Roseovarius aestuarii TaxID=475083 RepID=A0A1X7BNQ4_9RHOB|nr:NAD(P)/FAD-dependent oxidoreductase [Roseovarius aestuarii]SMC11242.1 4-hydroxyacetophenone monooxygenase [Roseovarius aestuarii]